jgi:hypothetical protein
LKEGGTGGEVGELDEEGAQLRQDCKVMGEALEDP